jgi:hypothetical protein
MHMILCDPAGRYAEAILLSATRDRMRVIVQGQEDTMEVCQIGTQWISDSGSPMEIQSLFTEDPKAAARIWSDAIPRAAGAAS